MLSIGPGYDPTYLTGSVGAGAENYYLSATVEHGEPSGYWAGRGASDLDLTVGSVVDPVVMAGVYGREGVHLDPRDPDFVDKNVPVEAKARLGRRLAGYRSVEALYGELLAAEPDAGPERQRVLQIEAEAAQRKNLLYLDLTFSPDKSVSLLHAGLQQAAAGARAAGDAEVAGRYAAAALEVESAIKEAGSVAIGEGERVAGEARAGYHGPKVEGRSTGRWVAGGRWVVASFFQHTSRDGDPQLHLHQAVLNRQLCADGQWRSLDSQAVHKVRPYLAAVAERTMEERLSRSLGVAWRSRPDGNGRQLVGVSAEQIAAFSARRVEVTAAMRGLVEAYTDKHGRAPDARALFSMAQFATRATKAPKRKEQQCPSRAQQLAGWEAQATAAEVAALRSIPANTIGRVGGEQLTATAAKVADLEVDQVLAAAVADAQAAKAVFTRYDITRMINRHLPDSLGGLHPAQVTALLNELTDRAIAAGNSAGVVTLTVPPLVAAPADLCRPDGTSVYEAPCAARYTTEAHLATETGLLERAKMVGAPAVKPEQATRALNWAPGGTGAPAGGLRVDQAEAVYQIATSGRAVDVLIGPAGSGKTYAIGQLAKLWHERAGGKVVGLSLGQHAAEVMAAEGVGEAWNIDRWGHYYATAATTVAAGDLIVVDEAAMAPTEHLARIQTIATAAGAKVVWTGDPAQLSAPGAGGMMALLADDAGAYELTEVTRMDAEWERAASLQLRAGELAAIEAYDRHGRWREGSREQMEARAVGDYVADTLTGRDTLLLAGSAAAAARLSGRVRAELAALGRVEASGVELADENLAGDGDLIETRHNDHEIRARDGRSVTNRDRYRVIGRNADGRLLARRVADGDDDGPEIELRADYVREHVELGYAGTVHSAQGRTVEVVRPVIDAGTSREHLYVMMTRAQQLAIGYVVVDDDRAADLSPTTAAAPALAGDQREPDRSAAGVLAGILAQEAAEPAAVEVMRGEQGRASHAGVLAAIWTDVTRATTSDRWEQVLRAHLSPADYQALTGDPARASLLARLQAGAITGRDDVDQVLAEAINERDFAGARSIGQVLHHRLDRRLKAADVNPDDAAARRAATWAGRTPHLDDPNRDQYARELAEAIDTRAVTLGYQTASDPPEWAREHLGPMPTDPIDRLGWIGRAAQVAIYREAYHHTGADPLGPAPGPRAPEQRAAWQTAWQALGRPETGRDVAEASDGHLHAERARWQRAAGWAPANVANELRETTMIRHDLAQQAIRARAQAATTGGEAARRLVEQAEAADQTAAKMCTHQGMLEEIDAARTRWHQATTTEREAARRATDELRRRHPDTPLAPLGPDEAAAQHGADQPTPARDRSASTPVTPRPADIRRPHYDERPDGRPVAAATSERKDQPAHETDQERQVRLHQELAKARASQRAMDEREAADREAKNKRIAREQAQAKQAARRAAKPRTPDVAEPTPAAAGRDDQPTPDRTPTQPAQRPDYTPPRPRRDPPAPRPPGIGM